MENKQEIVDMVLKEFWDNIKEVSFWDNSVEFILK